MIAALLLLQAPVLPDALPRQRLPATGCSAFLWSAGENGRRLVAVAGADAGTLRLSLGGRALDLPRAGPPPSGPLGLGGTAAYRGPEAAARLEIDVVQRADLTGGAAVPTGALTVERPGADAVVLPVAGLVGCATTPR